jgi:hypothetical protein
MQAMFPIIVTARMGKADQQWAEAQRREHYPPDRNVVPAHITLFQHLPPRHWPEIRARLAALTHGNAAPPAQVSDVMLLGGGVAYRVDCPGLLAMRDTLAADLQGLLIPQDQPVPRLHITVQNKVAPAVAKALYAKLSAGFQPRPLAITGLAAHSYRGGPWEELQSWAFSGLR